MSASWRSGLGIAQRGGNLLAEAGDYVAGMSTANLVRRGQSLTVLYSLLPLE